MIATTLFGGMGNQMFIYAMARAMALKNGVSASFNIVDGFKYDFLYKRQLELKHFCLDLPVKNNILLFSIPFGHYIHKISDKIGIHLLKPNYKYIKENADLHFQEELTLCQYKNVYLEGYWQSPMYFSGFEEIIHDDFQIKTSIPKETLDEWEYLKATGKTLVFVGVRRYQEAIGKNCPLTVCNANFYNEAMRKMKEKIDDPLFVIFGEQKEWAEANLSSQHKKYFIKKKSGELSAISDLFLMRNCHHAIISNSTYYWWGAWLQVKDQSKHYVIAPDNFINPDTPCKEWEILTLKNQF